MSFFQRIFNSFIYHQKNEQLWFYLSCNCLFVKDVNTKAKKNLYRFIDCLRLDSTIHQPENIKLCSHLQKRNYISTSAIHLSSWFADKRSFVKALIIASWNLPSINVFLENWIYLLSFLSRACSYVDDVEEDRCSSLLVATFNFLYLPYALKRCRTFFLLILYHLIKFHINVYGKLISLGEKIRQESSEISLH